MHSKCCFSSSGAPASGFRSPVSKSTKTLCCELSSSLLSVLLKVVNTVECFQELLLWLWPDLDCKQTLTLKSNIHYNHVSKGNLRGSRSLSFTPINVSFILKNTWEVTMNQIALNLQSYTPSLYLDVGKEGMIHLFVRSYVQKTDSVFSLIGRETIHMVCCLLIKGGISF